MCHPFDDRRRDFDNGVFDRFDEMDETAADDAEDQQQQQEEMTAAATARRLAFRLLLRLVLTEEIRRIGGFVAGRLMRGARWWRRGFRWFRNMDGWLGRSMFFIRRCRHGDWFRKTRADFRRGDSHDLQP